MTHFDAASPDPRSGTPILPTAAVVRITLVCFAVSMINGFDTLMLAFVAPLLAHSLHIDHAALGRVFGAGSVGTVLGSLIAGPLADRFGRRPMLLLALAVTGLFMLACAFAGSATSLATLRFLGGLGMGSAIPAVVAITAESSTAQRRSSLVILMFIGFPLGAVVGGAITAALMMRFGWPFVFLMGGICALAAIVPVLLVIPSTAIVRTVHTAPTESAATSASRGLASRAFGSFVGNLLADGRLASTLALWFGVVASMILTGFLVSFVPTILNLNGIAPDRAALGAVVLNLGAIVGALLISTVVGRIGPFVPVAISSACGAVLVFALGRVIGTGNAAFGMLFVTGACLVGGQLTIPAIASRLFPTPVRASGIGSTMAIGQMGSIIGPLVGGILLAQKLPLDQIFMIAALLAVCGSLGFALVAAWRPRETIDPRIPASPFTISQAESGNGKS